MSYTDNLGCDAQSKARLMLGTCSVGRCVFFCLEQWRRVCMNAVNLL